MGNKPEENRRQSRALLPILGSFISSVTGLALESDLENLQKNIVQINNFVNKELNVSTKFVSDTSLFVKLTNERLVNLIQEVNNKSLKTVKLIERVDRENTLLIDYVANITLHKFQFYTAMSDLTIHYSNLLAAIQSLANGNLPSFLFTEDVLKSMLQTVHDSVVREFNGKMQIIHKDIHYYYNHAQFICTRFQDNLYVKLNIPLTGIPDTFSFYRIKKFPIPLNQDQYSHVTEIENIPEAIAVSVAADVYFALTNFELMNFHHDSSHDVRRIFFKIEPYDCIMAILFDDKLAVKSHCSFSIILQSIKPDVYNMFGDVFLLTNISAYTLQCGDVKAVETGCSACLLEIDKRCFFQSGKITVPRIAHTNGNISNTTTKQHIVNLAVLVNLFDHDLISQIAGDSKFFHQPDLSLPSYSFYSDSLSKNFVENEQVRINL